MDSHIDYIYVTNHHNTFLRRKLLWKIYVTFWKPTSATFVNCFFISQSQVLLSICPLKVTGVKYSVFRIQWFFMPALPFRLCVAKDFILVTSYSEGEECPGELIVFDRKSGEYLFTLAMDPVSHLGGLHI